MSVLHGMQNPIGALDQVHQPAARQCGGTPCHRLPLPPPLTPQFLRLLELGRPAQGPGVPVDTLRKLSGKLLEACCASPRHRALMPENQQRASDGGSAPSVTSTCIAMAGVTAHDSMHQLSGDWHGSAGVQEQQSLA